ncbi:hypothetical protein CONPUDRAFT_78143 [Coniophora puteana RWD-64-598 SS2]|uniref:Uncharacterized protein n=1 Tax=Coniophora puteana (strain RWD-64-598) TaxID=741705 RepID=R7SDD2_CONPW|nr:uncharacterized protein CONPUDRAFT_78143 [Coniophora puteana RWD-64-598 SS2]EIW74171.1 hypothetical protein CONPUDRAFT_78143 [Coniophora puteana RWD-64-598 SS2]
MDSAVCEAYEAELRETLNVSEPRLSERLSNVFAKMETFDLGDDYIFTAICTLSDMVAPGSTTVPNITCKARTPFHSACVNNGLVELVLNIILVPWGMLPSSTPRPFSCMTQWQAWGLLVKLVRFGDIQERSHVLDKLMEGDIISICLSQLKLTGLRLPDNAPPESFLTERISANTAGEILRSLYNLALQDPNETSDQLNDPETLWQFCQEEVTFDDPWNDTDESRSLMSSRIFGNVQCAGLDAARILLTMDPYPSQHRYLEVLKQQPHVIDLLLECILLEHPDGFPESSAPFLASENLCAFFRWPSYLVPGVSTPADKAYSTKDRKALVQSMQMLTSHVDWAERIVEAWMKSEPSTEDNERIQSNISAVISLYGDSKPPSRKEIFVRRVMGIGRCRISLLRLISIISYNADGAGVRNVDIYSLLPITYCACHKSNDPNKWLTEACDWPIWAPLKEKYEREFDPFYVAPETLQGPVAFARLLVVLAQRNALDSTQMLQKAPADLSTATSLAQIKHTTHPDIITRFFHVSFFRLDEALKRGRTLMKDLDRTGKPDSGLLFASAAELAAAMVTFDDCTGGAYTSEALSGARFMLALLLSFVTEVAMKRHRYRRAYFCSLAAVSAAESIPPDNNPPDGWAEDLVELKRQARAAKLAFEKSNDVSC